MGDFWSLGTCLVHKYCVGHPIYSCVQSEVFSYKGTDNVSPNWIIHTVFDWECAIFNYRTLIL